MKKILSFLLILALLLSGCTSISPSIGTEPSVNATVPTQAVNPTEPSQPAGTEAPTDPVATEIAPTEPAPTEPAPTETVPTEPAPTEPQPTQPPATEPAPTQPKPTEPPVPAGSFNIHFIDVGQADCALIECDGEYILIDGGNKDDGQLVVSYLQKQGVTELELVIGSHAHEDHIGGLAGVLAVYPTRNVWCPVKSYNSQAFRNFKNYADQQGRELIKPAVGTVFAFGSATVTVLGPVKSYSDPNNTSIVVMVQYGNNRFLFTGDMESDAESDLLNSGANVKADLLKVGHHGSYTSTSYRFLREVAPKYAVISVGAGNSYGHPHADPLSRLRDAEVMTYRTDLLGTIVVSSDGTNLSFTWQKTSAQPSIPAV